MIVNRLPGFIGQTIQRNAKALRRIRNIQYCPPKQFSEHVEKIEAAFGQVLWLGIAPVHRDWEHLVPGICQAIAGHNAILQKQSFLSLSDLSEADIMEDHHHLTAAGHARVAEWLKAHPALTRFVSEAIR